MALLKRFIRAAKGDLRKAWTLQKGKKSSSIKKKKSKRLNNMAKRHKKTSRSNKNGFVSGTVGVMLGAAAYGASRAWISQAIAPVSSKLPLGDISDEVVLLGLSLAGKKMLPSQLRGVARAGVIIESARLGDYLAAQALNQNKVSVVNQQSVW